MLSCWVLAVSIASGVDWESFGVGCHRTEEGCWGAHRLLLAGGGPRRVPAWDEPTEWLAACVPYSAFRARFPGAPYDARG